jgi:hypothetical protein
VLRPCATLNCQGYRKRDSGHSTLRPYKTHFQKVKFVLLTISVILRQNSFVDECVTFNIDPMNTCALWRV